MTGASGAIYPLRLLQRLRRQPNVEIHLILSRAGERTLYLETGKLGADLKAMAHYSWPLEDISAPLASGSFQTDSMVVAPCSIQSMSAIACGISSNLLIRAADVVLKERRRLVLMVRETPFHLGHLRTMTALTEMGAIIAPPIPGFYNRPTTIEDLVDSSVDRVLDLIGVSDASIRRWQGAETPASAAFYHSGPELRVQRSAAHSSQPVSRHWQFQDGENDSPGSDNEADEEHDTPERGTVE